MSVTCHEASVGLQVDSGKGSSGVCGQILCGLLWCSGGERTLIQTES